MQNLRQVLQPEPFWCPRNHQNRFGSDPAGCAHDVPRELVGWEPGEGDTVKWWLSSHWSHSTTQGTGLASNDIWLACWLTWSASTVWGPVTTSLMYSSAFTGWWWLRVQSNCLQSSLPCSTLEQLAWQHRSGRFTVDLSAPTETLSLSQQMLYCKL